PPSLHSFLHDALPIFHLARFWMFQPSYAIRNSDGLGYVPNCPVGSDVRRSCFAMWQSACRAWAGAKVIAPAVLCFAPSRTATHRSEEHTSELQSLRHL